MVTDHGIADLRGLTHDRRAEALIAAAAPAFRPALATGWEDWRRHARPIARESASPG
ncbi:acetyl-CoA hydrolase/transferase C-terminal domain-containing protein [Tistrella bauzanensis]